MARLGTSRRLYGRRRVTLPVATSADEPVALVESEAHAIDKSDFNPNFDLDDGTINISTGLRFSRIQLIR